MGKKVHCFIGNTDNIHFDGALLIEEKIKMQNISRYLSVKRILLQLIDTLELTSVTLHHRKAVFCPIEDLNLIEHLVSTSLEFPLSSHQNICAPLPILTQPCCLQLVSVGVDNQRQPESVDIIQGKDIQVRHRFEVVIGSPSIQG